MALISIIGVAVLGILGAAVSRLMADEFKAWVPWIIQHLIDWAVSTLPEDKRERFAEEWSSHVNEIPGDVGKLTVALGFLVAASKMAGIPTSVGKRIFDAALSASLIISAAPTFLLVALLIKLDSHGPILFRLRRIGQGGQPFHIFRFRTRSVADGYRLTRVGIFLRRTRLDESPQLFNILAGDMSFVGPRPLLPNHDATSVLHQNDVKPGLVLDYEPLNHITSTGQAGRYNKELDYLQNRSLFRDVRVMAKVCWRFLTSLL